MRVGQNLITVLVRFDIQKGTKVVRNLQFLIKKLKKTPYNTAEPKLDEKFINSSTNSNYRIKIPKMCLKYP